MGWVRGEKYVDIYIKLEVILAKIILGRTQPTAAHL